MYDKELEIEFGLSDEHLKEASLEAKLERIFSLNAEHYEKFLKPLQDLSCIIDYCFKEFPEIPVDKNDFDMLEEIRKHLFMPSIRMYNTQVLRIIKSMKEENQI